MKILSDRWRILGMKFGYPAFLIGTILMVGIIAGSPHFLARQSIGDGYRGIPFLFLDDEDIYLSRIREVVEGHSMVGSAAFYEYRNLPALMPPVGEIAYALPTIALGIPLTWVVVISKFVFPATLFLLVYLLVAKLLGENSWYARIISLSTALLVVFGYDLVDYRSAMAVLRGQPSMHMLVWTRLVNPITGALLLFGYCISLWHVLHRKRWVWTVVSGLLLGIMITYVFSWALGIAMTVCVLAWSLICRDNRSSTQVAAAVIVSFLVQIPFWWVVIANIVAGGQGSAARMGLLVTHAPVLNKVLVVSTFILIATWTFGYFRKARLRDWFASYRWGFVFSAVVASWMVFIQQVFTGKTIWPYHFVQYTIPMAMITISVCGYETFRAHGRKVWSVVMLIAAGLSIVYAAHGAMSYRYQLRPFADSQRNADLYAWFLKNAQPDCVVLVNEAEDYLARQIPAYTQCYTYHGTSTFYNVPLERVKHNYLMYLRLKGIQPDAINGYLRAHPGEVNTLFFTDWNELFAPDLTPATQLIADQLAHEYQAGFDRDFIQSLQKYKIDYIISQDIPDVLHGRNDVSEVGQEGGWKIFAIK